MMKDFKSVRRIYGKNEEIENIPQYPNPSSLASSSLDSSRAPLNAIQEPDIGAKGKADRTPVKSKGRNGEFTLPLRTPEKHSLGFSARSRFGWGELGEDSRVADISSFSTQVSRGVPVGNANIATPRVTRTVGRANSNYSESTSTQYTPTKSVNKPPSSVGFRNKVDVNGGGRLGNFTALYKGIPSSGAPTCIVNTVDVPHFDLKEDPSFWMDHNVQVLIRVRPLNSMERSAHGYNRCLKQESAQTVTWIAQPETRFTFDHVASESVDQDTLFRMVGLPMVENCLSGYNSCMFAYGQTGSGKTYTMLGEIEDLEQKPSVHRGMTPRIFEFLFARIQAEEESRNDERLKYNCKCSFLEIYNEQITDLLDPSSTNLMLREDSKNGVYVENLSEFEVQTVSDILSLLTQGSSNRKVAATNMNRESSRSHCVFTCVIESRWEKDSTSNLRFARLNLVDLAGSERQKTSGAEGDRLKEAANINKSLSTLGHVIMVLVDVAHGRPRHIPYRDSRLTFLLQDSLGGNSKTIIVANVSPSMSCAAETFNTLKFAQRAKLIQNNAVVNEDSTGDVQALQRQIRLLKAELAALKSQNVSRCLSFGSISMSNELSNKNEDDQHQQDEMLAFESKGVVRMSTEQLKSLETTLGGALRREQIADVSIRQLQDEIEQLNHLVKKREEENMRTKMTLKFREDRIHRMESVVAGSISSDAYLLEDNKALNEEIQLLQAKIDSHPEVTRFATENIRLQNELLRYQEFYEEGERESLLAEISNLRNQLLRCTTDGDSEQQVFTRFSLLPQIAVEENKENGSLQIELESTLKELEGCRHNLNCCVEENTKLTRELDDLRSMFGKFGCQEREDLEKNPSGEIPMELCMDEEDHKEMEQDKATARLSKSNAEEIIALQLELDILKTILEEERASKIESEERALGFYRDLEQTIEDLSSMTRLYENINSELKEAKSVIEALESQQVHSINELEELQKSNAYYKKLSSVKEVASRRMIDQAPQKELAETEESSLQLRLNNMQLSLEIAKQRILNEEDMDEVQRQAEIETAEVIVCMQEELAILQQQVQDSEIKETETKKGTVLLEQKLLTVNDENKQLNCLLEEKERVIDALSEEWRMLTYEMEEVLSNGHEAIEDASSELESIYEKRVWISEHLSQMVRMISEKEFQIEELSRCLEDANSKRSDLETMLKSLRGATLVITEAHQQECSEKESLILSMTSELKAKTYEMDNIESKLKLAEDNIRGMSLCSTAAFVLVNRLSEVNAEHVDELMLKNSLLSERGTKIEASEKQIECLKDDLARLENTCAVLREQLVERQKHVFSMQQKLEVMEEVGILQARDKLYELKDGVSSLRSSMDMLSEVEKQNTEKYSEMCMELSDCSHREGAQEFLCEATPESEGQGTCDRDVTISVFKREVASALDNLKQVQAEMVKIQSEKKERLIFEKQNKDNVNSLVSQVLILQLAIDRFEEQTTLKMNTFNDKLQNFEQSMMDVGNDWSKAKQLHEDKVEDAEIAIAQKSAEASFMLAKFEEAQETLKEADLMINELVIANEAVKIDIERQKIFETSLVKDKVKLMKEVERLQSIIAQRDEEFEVLEKQFMELEGIASGIMSSSMENLGLLDKDLNNVRSTTLHSTKSLNSCLEEIWSEIIVRDCAVSSLHLCHMGIMLETVTGLNAENGLLQRGLHETNSVVSDLREHNSRSRKELEACSVLKGKLLSDIKNGFDRISKKESEAVDLSKKITSFEQKVSQMQLQEEMMLERSNSIGSQLAALTKELDLSNQSAVASLLNQEKCMNYEIENFMLLSCSRDLEAFILAKEMEEMGDGNLVIAEKLVEEVIFSKMDAEMKEQILLDFENERIVIVEEAERTKQDLLVKLNESKSRIAEMCGAVKSLEDEVKSKSDVECANGKLKGEIAEITDAKMSLASQIQSVQSEYESLKMDMEALRDEKRIVFQDLSEQKSRCESSSTSIDTLNKEAAELKGKVTDLEAVILKDKIVIFELNQENEKLQGDVRGLREEYESLGMEMEALRNQNSLSLQDLAEKRSKCESSSTTIESLSRESAELKDKVADLEAVVLASKGLITKLNEENQKLQDDVSMLKGENSVVLQELEDKKSKCELSSVSIDALNKESVSLKSNLAALETSIAGLQSELDLKNETLHEALELKDKVADLEAVVLTSKILIVELNEENQKLQGENNVLLHDLEDKKSKCESSLASIDELNNEAVVLKTNLPALETIIADLQSDLGLRNFELSELKDAQSLFLEELDLKNETLRECADAINSLQTENDLLKKNLETAENIVHEFHGLTDSRSFELADELFQRSHWTSKFIEDLECANNKCKKILHENLDIQVELARKDEIQEGLLFDLRMLQESASNVQDQKDEIEEMAASLEALEDEIEGITAELDRAVANGEMLEAQLKEKTNLISALKLDISKESNSAKILKEENTELKASAEEALVAKSSLDELLTETRNLNESLEMELEQLNDSIDCLKSDLDRLNIERNELNNEVLDLKEELQKAKDAALKSEAFALEAQQIAVAKQILAHEKDEEVSLLERSIKELECTINVLENKVDIVQGEAERQRLLREELESELHSVKIQMENVRNADADMKLHFTEKKAELEDALKQIDILERDAAQKDAEVSQCKAHISELNLHAEAQANEYKLKFKELEAMAEQVRSEGSFSSTTQIFNSVPSKSDKNGPKPRGAGSPFKCIGLGMAQQIKSEKDEEVTSLRQRIDELESIVISKQKEIFTLNSKLASAESMTHDVIRDLLGVKLDMTSYASLLDSQGDKISDNLQGRLSESQLPCTTKLNEQLDQFVEERRKWLREMEQKQAELVSAEIALEKLRKREQLLTAENSMLKMENSNYRKKSMELEEEITKLYEQQNLVHRINHHAKIKDENNILKARNEDLSNKLQLADSVISQVKQELASYRASLGKVPPVDFDEEQLWKDRLKETEEERVKLAEKLLALCTSILRVAGFKGRVTHSSVTIAEDVLEQLKNKINSMQSELHDLKTKNKIYKEQIRISELRSQPTSTTLRLDENRRSRTPKRMSRTSFVSTLDR